MCARLSKRSCAKPTDYNARLIERRHRHLSNKGANPTHSVSMLFGMTNSIILFNLVLPMATLIFTSKAHTGHTMQVEEHKNCHNRAEISLRSLSVQIRLNPGHLAEQSYYQNILFFVTLALSYSQIDYVQTKSTLSWRGRSDARHDRIGRLPIRRKTPS